MQNRMNYHNPVLLTKSVNYLVNNPDGIYVDCTFGGGGHSKEILNRLSDKGKLYAFDQDAEAQDNKIEDPRFTLIAQNFKFLKNFLRFYKVDKVDGVLADLGVSSHQFDTGERGFSTRFDGPLDMRMNQLAKLDASIILEEYSFEALCQMFREYGDIRNANQFANLIIQQREVEPIKTTQDLKTTLKSIVPDYKANKIFAQVFQALRIEVNGELDALKDMLQQCAEVIKPDGRLVAISYHSLEDRLVKRFIRNGMFSGEPEKDIYGNWYAPFKPLQSKVMLPEEEEIKSNPRARSAKMRVGIKNEENGEK